MIATCLLLERIFNLLVAQKSAFRISKRGDRIEQTLGSNNHKSLEVLPIA